MNGDLFILLGGDPYAFPNAGLFLLATLAGAAAELSERRCKKNSRFLLPTAAGAAIGLAAGTLLMLSGDRRADDLFLFWCAAGTIGGFLGAAVVKARKKRKNGDASGEESSEKSYFSAGKKREKVLKIVKIVFGGVLFVALATGVYVAAKVTRMIWLFNNFDECRREYVVALEKGEFAQALEVALESEKIAAKLDDRRKAERPARLMKALAYELTGDLDAALENYRKGKGADTLRDARLAYKKGEKAAAFKLYCAYPETALAKSNDDAKKLARRREEARVGVMCEDLYAEHHYCGEDFDGRVLAPFATYSDFLTFMESEFKAQGEPAERAEAMEFFRTIATNDGATKTEAPDGAAPKL